MDKSEFSFILLAAGKSERMESPKGLLKIKNQSWIENQIQAIESLGFDNIIVVLGYDSEKYFEVLKNKKIKFVINSMPERGKFSSLKNGLDVLPKYYKGVFILPIDTPISKSSLCDEMIINLNDVDVVVPSYRHKGGHPVLISKNFANQLRIKDDHSRLDHLIGELDTNKIKYLNTDDDIILLNLNTKFEWEKYLSSFKQEKS